MFYHMQLQFLNYLKFAKLFFYFFIIGIVKKFFTHTVCKIKILLYYTKKYKNNDEVGFQTKKIILSACVCVKYRLYFTVIMSQ